MVIDQPFFILSSMLTKHLHLLRPKLHLLKGSVYDCPQLLSIQSKRWYTANPTPTDNIDFVPTSPAFFTGNPKYYDLIYEIQRAIGGIQVADDKINQVKLGFPTIYQSVRKTFKSLDTLNLEQGLNMKLYQYEKLLDHLVVHRIGNVLGSITNEPKDVKQLMHQISTVQDIPLVTPFINPHEQIDQSLAISATDGTKLKINALDTYNRSFGKGSRKTSRAHAWIVRNPMGLFYVNGVPVSEFFDRRHTESATFPLHVTQTFNQFNVWVVVKGGGLSGQASACSVAVARALASHLPQDQHENLDLANLFKSDCRQVERKKPGQKKARKKFAWVKR